MLRLFTLIVIGSVALSARGESVFNGITVARDQPRFSLFSEEEKTNEWISLGESFVGFTAVAFDPQTGVLTLEKNHLRKDLRLQGSVVKDAGPEDAKARIRNLKGLELAYELARQGDEKIKALLTTYQRILARLAEANALPAGKSDAERIANNTAIVFLRNQAEDFRMQILGAAAAQAARLLGNSAKP